MFVTFTGRQVTLLYFNYLVPRGGPRNLRVFGETTNSLSVAWDHADGPVQQYRIIYSPTVGDPIDEYVSLILIYLSVLQFLTWLEDEIKLSSLGSWWN